MADRRQGWGGHARRLVTAAVAVAAAGCLAAPAATADDGLSESSDSRFVVNTEDRRIDVTVIVKLRNTLRDKPTSDGIYTYYFDGYEIPVPPTATRVRATSGGQSLPVTLVEGKDDEEYSYALARFPQLHSGATRTVTYRYQVPAAPVRSKDPTRVGDGYAAFEVLGYGDPGRASVEVVVPAGMEFTSATDGFTSRRDGDTERWRAAAPAAENAVWSFVSVRDGARVAEHPITVAGDKVTVSSFAGDDAWADFVGDKLAAGVPLLEDHFGAPWPGGLSRIREDVAPAVTGYAWFDHDVDEIVLGEEFDTRLLLHEASHAWLNRERFVGRWLYEGLADVVAHRVGERIGGTEPRPSVPERGGMVAIPLSDWGEGAKTRLDEAEQYGYDASYTAVQQLVGGLDDARFAEVVGAAYAGESAYDRPGTVAARRHATDWRRFLDLVEDRGGNPDAIRIYRTWVLDYKEQDQLAEREKQRATYRATDASDAAWQPPRGLRQLMTQWQFPRAGEVMDSLAGAAAAAGRLQQTARATGVPEPASVRQAYEEADTRAEYDALGDRVRRAAAVVEQVGDATASAAADPDPFTGLGELLLGVDASAQAARDRLGAGDLEAAAALATTVTGQSGWTRWLGVGVVAAGLGALAGIAAGTVWLRRRSAKVGARQLDQPDVAADGLGTQPQVVLTGLGPAGPGEAGRQGAGDGGDVGPDRDAGGDPDGQRT